MDRFRDKSRREVSSSHQHASNSRSRHERDDSDRKRRRNSRSRSRERSRKHRSRSREYDDRRKHNKPSSSSHSSYNRSHVEPSHRSRHEDRGRDYDRSRDDREKRRRSTSAQRHNSSTSMKHHNHLDRQRSDHRGEHPTHHHTRHQHEDHEERIARKLAPTSTLPSSSSSVSGTLRDFQVAPTSSSSSQALINVATPTVSETMHRNIEISTTTTRVQQPSIIDNDASSVASKLRLATAKIQASLAAAASVASSSSLHSTISTTAPQIPAYYNSNRVNATRLAEQQEKRRLLWGDSKLTTPRTKTLSPSNGCDEFGSNDGASQQHTGNNDDKLAMSVSSNSNNHSSNAPSTVASLSSTTSNVWTNLTFQGEHGSQMTEKFRKLMGIRSANDDVKQSSQISSSNKTTSQSQLFNELDAQYSQARAATHTNRGMGLGFR